MRRLRKILIIVVSILVLALIGGMIYINLNLPDLPAITNKIIDKTLEKNDYKLRGDEGYALNDNTRIWYESIKPEDTIKGHIILIMGISNNALAWPDYFINSLVDSGYHVIRYDNRGTGMSDWVEDWTEETAYSLEDLAEDAIAILDTLEIEKAHVIGASFGGMIAQTLCINYPHRVHTLVSMISTGDIMDSDLPPINMNTIKKLVFAQIRYGIINTESNIIKLQITSRLLLMGDEKYDLDLENIVATTSYDIKERNGFNPDASQQHITATMLTGSRYEELHNISTPTLVIHGKSDPLIGFSHGLKTYNAIHGADSLWIEGMGHDIPPIYNDMIVNKIITHISKTSEYNE